MNAKESVMKTIYRAYIPAIILILAYAVFFNLQIKTYASSTTQGPEEPSIIPSFGGSATETEILTGTFIDINGVFKAPLRVPGGTKDSIFTLYCDGSSVIGNITNPFNPEEKSIIYNGKAEGNKFNFSTRIGRAEYNFEGTAGDGGISMTLTTFETIHLDEGSKVKTSKDMPIDGAYLVPVYSPGGIMENIFFLKTEGNTLTGQMVMISNPMKDKSDFFDGTVNGNEISFYTRTPQSLFHFKGNINGDKIRLDMIVTDIIKGIKGAKM